MADRLVQQHAAEAVAHHHGHAAGGRVHGVEQRQGAAGGLGPGLLAALQELEAGVATEGVGAGLDPVAVTGHDLAGEPHARPVVGGRHTVGVEDLDQPAPLGVADPGLADCAAGSARLFLGRPQQVGLSGGVDLPGRGHDGVLGGRPGRGQGGRLASAGAHRARHRVRHPEEVGFVKAVHVTEVGGLPRHHPHSGSPLRAGLRALHPPVVERQREAAAVLGVDLRQVAATGQRPREHALGQRRL